MARLSDWPERLNAVIRSANARPFAWGENDCCTFAGRCVEAVTGENPCTAFGVWEDEASAGATLEAGGGIEAILDARFQRIPAAMAGRGDVVLVANPNGEHVVAVLGGSDVLTPGKRGLARLRRDRALAAWRV